MKGILRIDYEEELNEEQKKWSLPISPILGLLSGRKTLPSPIEWQGDRGRVDPSSLLLAITNKAAREMLHR